MKLKINKVEVFVVAGPDAKYKTSFHYSDLVITKPQAQSPIDIALWDLVAKYAGMPLPMWLGS